MFFGIKAARQEPQKHLRCCNLHNDAECSNAAGYERGSLYAPLYRPLLVGRRLILQHEGSQGSESQKASDPKMSLTAPTIFTQGGEGAEGAAGCFTLAKLLRNLRTGAQ